MNDGSVMFVVIELKGVMEFVNEHSEGIMDYKPLHTKKHHKSFSCLGITVPIA